MKKIKVGIIDDSAVVRQVLSEVIQADAELELVFTASDPIFALEKMKDVWPEVLVLDIEMPRMDGITFLQKIMKERPTPVVICSTLTEENSETTMLALSSGAVEVITKPKVGLKSFLTDSSEMLVLAIKAASLANLSKMTFSSPVKIAPKNTADAILKSPTSTSIFVTTDKIVAIGTSTGGTQALESVLTKLPATSPGIVIVQHMPEKFTLAFANRLNSICNLEVKEASHLDRVVHGRVLIAPGNKHMLLKRSGAQYHVEIVDGPLVSRHRPSVDVLFRSVAKYAGKNALGIIMTGMGDDGSAGLLEMLQSGSRTIAQDEESSVVFGMPKEAIKKGAVEKVVSLQNIPVEITKYGSSEK